jgi:hypothetical protein
MATPMVVIPCAMQSRSHLLGLLRPRRKRPSGSRAAEQRYELASPHSITSSARASSVDGTSRPSAVIRRSCYNKAPDLEHGFHTPALLGES